MSKAKIGRPIFVLYGDVSSEGLMLNISDNFEGDIIIFGCLRLFGELKLRASLWVFGDISAHCYSAKLEVVGDLICTGNCYRNGDIIVHGIFYCEGNIELDYITSEDFECEGNVEAINILADNITVKQYIRAGSIEYYNELNCKNILHGTRIIQRVK